MYFVSQDNSSVNYSKECLGELVRQIPSELTDLDPVYIDNLVYFRLDATNVSINDTQRITNDIFVPLLNDKLESCVDDYSIYVFNQSTICECKPNTTKAVRERVNVVNLCDELACTCTSGLLLFSKLITLIPREIAFPKVVKFFPFTYWDNALYRSSASFRFRSTSIN